MRFSDVSVECDRRKNVRVGIFSFKVAEENGEESMSGTSYVVMLDFAEVRVERLTKKMFSSGMVYRIQLGATDGPNDTGSILSTIFGKECC